MKGVKVHVVDDTYSARRQSNSCSTMSSAMLTLLQSQCNTLHKHYTVPLLRPYTSWMAQEWCPHRSVGCQEHPLCLRGGSFCISSGAMDSVSDCVSCHLRQNQCVALVSPIDHCLIVALLCLIVAFNMSQSNFIREAGWWVVTRIVPQTHWAWSWGQVVCDIQDCYALCNNIGPLPISQ